MTQEDQAAVAAKAEAEIKQALAARDLYEVRVIRRKPCPDCGGQRDYDAADDSCLNCGRNMSE